MSMSVAGDVLQTQQRALFQTFNSPPLVDQFFPLPNQVLKTAELNAEFQILNPKSDLVEDKVNEQGERIRRIENIQSRTFSSKVEFEDPKVLPEDPEERRQYFYHLLQRKNLKIFQMRKEGGSKA